MYLASISDAISASLRLSKSIFSTEDMEKPFSFRIDAKTLSNGVKSTNCLTVQG